MTVHVLAPDVSAPVRFRCKKLLQSCVKGGHQCVAIYDSRALASSYPGLPPFECARFDLRSQAASMRDFGPIEEALIAGGFDIGMIGFQSSSTGRIIVSDGRLAALLEISAAC